MIIEKVCPHFTYQDDSNGEMVISCCTAMNQPEQEHEGNDKMYPCPLGFEVKQCYKVLSLGSDKVHQPTNVDRIRSMSKGCRMDKTLDWLYSDLDELIDFEYGESEVEHDA